MKKKKRKISFELNLQLEFILDGYRVVFVIPLKCSFYLFKGDYQRMYDDKRETQKCINSKIAILF